MTTIHASSGTAASNGAGTTSREPLQVVGGGLGGLMTAIAGREVGLRVTVHEAARRLGGRARSTQGPHVANWGPHALYAGGPLWEWLEQRNLLPECVEAALEAGLVFRRGGETADLPAEEFVAIEELRQAAPAPTELSFSEWATARVGPDDAAGLSSLAGVFSFHHDPGSLSAEFVFERLSRVLTLPAAARFVVGGWETLIDRLRQRALDMGATIKTRDRVEAIPDRPTVLALPLRRAATLLGDTTLAWTGSRVALVDLALERRAGDPYAVWDLDEAGWAETFTHRDPTLAPPGQHLVQAQMGMRAGETLSAAVSRVERLLDVGYVGWRDRVTWRRQAKVTDETGAVDLPGHSWRDRPDPDRGHGRFIVGDMVAAPGLLSEVVAGSAVAAVAKAAELMSAV